MPPGAKGRLVSDFCLWSVQRTVFIMGCFRVVFGAGGSPVCGVTVLRDAATVFWAVKLSDGRLDSMAGCCHVFTLCAAVIVLPLGSRIFLLLMHKDGFLRWVVPINTSWCAWNAVSQTKGLCLDHTDNGYWWTLLAYCISNCSFTRFS